MFRVFGLEMRFFALVLRTRARHYRGLMGTGLALLLLLMGQGGGEAARFVVDFAPKHGSEAWIAGALEKSVTRELGSFQRITAVSKSKVDTGRCVERKSECLLLVYGDAGIDLALLGSYGAGRLDLRIYETWTGSRIHRRSVSINDRTDRGRLRQTLIRAMGPVLQSGGLLDRKEFLRQRQSERASAPVFEGPKGPVLVFLGLFALWLLAPFLWAILSIQERSMAPPERGSAWVALVLMAFVVLVLFLVFATSSGERWIRAAVNWVAHGEYERPLAVVGGLLWGWFALLNLRIIIPRLPGSERIRHSNLGLLVQTWLVNLLLRCFFVVAYLPTVVTLYGLWILFELDTFVLFVGLAPLAGLLSYLWLLAMVESFSLYLDSALVDGVPEASNPWHLHAMKYFGGYLKRGGLRLGRRLLSNTLILPGKDPGIVTYGGGLTPGRIVIHGDLLEAALGSPDERSFQSELNVDYNAWGEGTLSPCYCGNESESRARRRMGRMRRFLKRQRRHQRERSVTMGIQSDSPWNIGQSATLLGWVLPHAQEETVPLISDTQDDFKVLRRLLTDHYAALDKRSFDEEHDDTDPKQKDFLFGAILREVGALHRRDGLFSSLTCSASVGLRRAPEWVKKIAGWFVELYMRSLSRYPALLADTYAALNLGKNHLIQCLDLLKSGKSDLLTARADAPELINTSREILMALAAEETEGVDRQIFRATLKNRLLWLSRFTYAPLQKRRHVLFKAFALVGGLAAAVGFLTFVIQEAVAYHSIYVARIQTLEQTLGENEQGIVDDVR